MSTTLPKIVVNGRLHGDVLLRLEAQCDVVINASDTPWPIERLAREAQDAVGIVAFMTDCITREFLAQCPDLGIVAAAVKGYDNFDVEACTEAGVWLTALPDLLTGATAELTLGLMIAMARHFLPGDAYVREGYPGWRPVFYGRTLKRSTVGIVGMGMIGQAVARRLKAFGCDVLYHDERPLPPHLATEIGLRLGALDELLETSDFVVLAVPLTAKTKHLVNRGLLSRVKRGAYLINTARGSIVDEEAVADALQGGTLAGYAADVYEMEDWARKDRPAGINPRLLGDRSRTVLTPHIGSADHQVRRDAEMDAAASILDYLAGRTPRGAVNLPVRKPLSC
jgi:phosphonate dehydrogenase